MGKDTIRAKIILIVSLIFLIWSVISLYKTDKSDLKDLKESIKTIKIRQNKIDSLYLEINTLNRKNDTLNNRISALKKSIRIIEKKQNKIRSDFKKQKNEILNSSDSLNWVWFQRYFAKF